MKARNRFIASIIATAKAESCRMPWHRGRRRRSIVERRHAGVRLRKQA